ncbi:MAG: DUF3054 domain-containing protein [Chloroflexota bacterium]
MTRTARLLVIAAVGDAVILLAFAAIGRSNHGASDGGPIFGTLGTAAPFLIGWFLAALVAVSRHTDPLGRMGRALALTGATWLAGGIVGLIIHSLIEKHAAPLPFVIVALLFNLVWLALWHAVLVLVGGRSLYSPTPRSRAQSRSH